MSHSQFHKPMRQSNFNCVYPYSTLKQRSSDPGGIPWQQGTVKPSWYGPKGICHSVHIIRVFVLSGCPQSGITLVKWPSTNWCNKQVTTPIVTMANLFLTCWINFHILIFKSVRWSNGCCTNLGISAVVLVQTSGAGFTESTGFISRFSVWLIHKSGGFSSLCFFFAEPFACITCL